MGQTLEDTGQSKTDKDKVGSMRELINTTTTYKTENKLLGEKEMKAELNRYFEGMVGITMKFQQCTELVIEWQPKQNIIKYTPKSLILA